MSAAMFRACLAFVLAVAFGFGLPERLTAQDANSPKTPDPQDPLIESKPKEIDFWISNRGVGVQAALHCIGPESPWGVLAARMQLSEYVPLAALNDHWEFVFDKVIPLHRQYLDLIRDGHTLPDPRAKELKELKPYDRGFFLAFIEALGRSHAAKMEQFKKSAEENDTVVYTHLRADPKSYRGKIITVKGQLVVLRRFNAHWMLQEQEDGLKYVYTGEIIGPTKGAPPFAVIMTELPEGLAVSERMNRSVTFQGYFLGFIRFPADRTRGSKQKDDVISPYLVGKSLIVHDKKDAVEGDAEPEPSLAYIYITVTMGGILVVVIIGVGLNMWFRSGDRKIHSQLADLRDRHQPFSVEPEDHPAGSPIKPPPELFTDAVSEEAPHADQAIKPVDPGSAGSVPPPASPN